MEIRQLKTFINIVKLGNFSHAAQFSGYTQSTITTHIQLLEKELNTLLFERFGQQISLTDDGQHLYDYAEKIIKLEDDAKNALNKSDIPCGPLIIGIPESLCVFRMTSLLKEYSSLYPDVELKIKYGTSNDFRILLRKKVMDLALFLEPSIIDPDLTNTPLWPEPIVFVTYPNNELTKLTELHPKMLNDQTLVLVESDSNYRILLEKTLQKEGVHLKTVLEVGQIQAIKQLIMQNFGITLLPLVSVAKELDAGELVLLPWKGPDINVTAFLVHHKDRWVNHPMKAFVKLLQERLINNHA
ncbi:HTH-type transcriptional regulator GltR [Sporomusa silvacetica DSM 10669]|uniref:HTH-type transcriptional regulator GltR n=1 Tax=Sporomusa silvacetica DSM 10669 TaxID=1123289 RepID=A0ABZ3IUT6_9FIRM|nr:LysR family transcriptional regulator [Sporomusa silvacetica]OZC15181.1 HTH-type transcriptional regulator GltR [Sporomusa silvacetica DSM 10669]